LVPSPWYQILGTASLVPSTIFAQGGIFENWCGVGTKIEIEETILYVDHPAMGNYMVKFSCFLLLAESSN